MQLRSKPLQFGQDLSPDEHNALIKKIIAVFEGDLAVAGDGPPPKVTMEQLFNFRFVVQAWIQTAAHCAKADLDEATFQTVSAAVEMGDALDSQMVSCLKGFPLEFGLTMLPDVRCLTSEGDVPEVEAETIIEKAEREEWKLGFALGRICRLHCFEIVRCLFSLPQDSKKQKVVFSSNSNVFDFRLSKLVALEAKLKLDQRLLESISDGYGVLGDCLDWITTQKKLKVAKQARTVVEEHMECFCPVLTVDGFDTFPGDLQGMLSRLSMMSDDASARRLIVFHLDFNIPGVPLNLNTLKPHSFDSLVFV